jgi:RNA polymerase sigma-B factor
MGGRAGNGRDHISQRAATVLRMLERMRRPEVGDPEREELRELVIAEYMPYARYIAAASLHRLVSLDMPVDADDGRGTSLIDLIGTDDSALQNTVDRETLRPLLAQLSPREKQILLMRYFYGMTHAQIGDELGVSQMQVSRLLSAILGRLRRRAGCDEAA